MMNKAQVTVRRALSKPTPYIIGWAWQQVLLERRLHHIRHANSPSNDSEHRHHIIDDNHNEDRDYLLLFQHEPVYTLGRGASEQHLTFLKDHDTNVDVKRLCKTYRGDDSPRLLLKSKIQPSNESDDHEVNELLNNNLIQNNPIYTPDNKAPIYRIERGGEVTYHGPGQLVLYPLLNLRRQHYEQDLHWYLRQMEQVIIKSLQEGYNIHSGRDAINTGVWVNRQKVAAVGVSSSRWITTHGCALNVDLGLDAFRKEIINPCGIEERDVTSLKDIMEKDGRECPTVEEVADVVVRCFGEVFDVDLSEGDVIS